jgi:serine/threonine protein kinase
VSVECENWSDEGLTMGQDDILSVGTLIDGRYMVRQRLGRGGAANVYLTEHVHLGTPLVVKVSRGDKNTGPSVLNEARVLARLTHARIIGVRDAGILPDGRSFLVTEWVDGDSLHRVYRHHAPSVQEALDVAEALLEAIEAVHDAGFIHRDVKPRNVIVPMEADSPLWRSAVLIDFSVCREMRDSSPDGGPRVRLGDLVGTVEYMAPEQARGLAHGPVADVYGVAATIYYLLLGCAPVKGYMERFFFSDRQCEFSVPIVPLSTEEPAISRSDLPAPVRETLEAMLRTRPRERPQSAHDALSSLRTARTQTAAVAGF